MIPRFLVVIALSQALAAPILADDKSNEDGLPPGMIRLGSSLSRSPDYIRRLRILPEGKHVAVIGYDSVGVMEISTGRFVRRFPIEKIDRSYAEVSPDGKLLVIATESKLVSYSLEDGRPLRSISFDSLACKVSNFSISLDSRFLVLGGEAKKPVVMVLDLSTGVCKLKVQPDAEREAHGQLTPDGKSLITFGHNGRTTTKQKDDGQTESLKLASLERWDVETGKRIKGIDVAADGRTDLLMSPAGERFASYGDSWSIFNAETLAVEHEFRENRYWGNPEAFSNDGRYLLAYNSKYEAIVWETTTGKEVRRKDLDRFGFEHAIPIAGDRFLTADKDSQVVVVRDFPEGRQLTPHVSGHLDDPNSLQFSSNDRILRSADFTSGCFYWNLEDGSKARPERPTWDPEGKISGLGHVQYVGKDRLFVWRDFKLTLLDATSGRELGQLPMFGNGWRHVISPDGDWIAKPWGWPFQGIGDFEGISVEYVPRKKAVGQAFTPPIRGRDSEIHFAPSNGFIAIRTNVQAFLSKPSPDRPWILMMVETATAGIKSQKIINDVKDALAVFRDDSTILWISPKPRLIDARSCREFELPGGDWASARFQFTPLVSSDGRLLAGVTTRPDALKMDTYFIQIWEIWSGKLRQEFPTGHCRVASLTFSHDGRKLAAGLSDGTIVVCDLRPAVRPGTELTVVELDRLWSILEKEDPKAGQEAIEQLVAHPAQSLPFLKQRLKSPRLESDRVDRLLADLDSREFKIRESADRELERLGVVVRPLLEQAIAKPRSSETGERLRKLLDRIPPNDYAMKWLRAIRAIEVLERVGSVDSVTHLKELATGFNDPMALSAKQALARLNEK